MSSTIELALWGPNGEPVTSLGRWKGLSVTPRFNAVGELKVTLSARDPKARHVFAEGSRITADLIPDIGPERRLLSGALLNATGQGPTTSGEWVGTYESDESILWAMQCLPVPGNPASDQTAAEYDVRTGPAETVLKGYVNANKHRLREGSRIVVAPDKGRGATITASMKFQTIGERLLPDIEKAGLGVSVIQNDAGQLVVDVYEPRVYGYDLSELDGTVTKWTVTVDRPTATRVFVAGSGERAARRYTEVGESPDAARWGRTIETFTESSQSDTGGGPEQAGRQALEAGAAKTGIAAEVKAGKKFRVGDNVWLGDQTRVELADGSAFELPLRELTITTQQGLNSLGLPTVSIVPTLGDVSQPATGPIFQALRQLARAVRRP